MHAGKTLILLYCMDLGLCNGNTQVIKLYQDLSFEDQISDAQPLKQTTSTSIIQCTNECILEQSCGSLFFNEGKHGVCVMQVSRMAAVNSVVFETGWKFYHKNQKLCPIASGYRYDSNLDTCIRPYVNGKTYMKAVQACLIENAVLVKIETQQMWELVKSTIAPISSTSQFYVQGTRDSSDVWRYDDSAVISFLPWGGNQPGEGGSDNHLVMFKNDGSLYHDVKGSRQYSYICEISMK